MDSLSQEQRLLPRNQESHPRSTSSRRPYVDAYSGTISDARVSTVRLMVYVLTSESQRASFTSATQLWRD
jgi:hypothetical protein